MSIRQTAANFATTANATLTSGATGLAGRAAGLASKGGILGKIAGVAAKGLGMFANLTPWGKAATLAVGALGLKSLVSSHPAGGRVG